MGLCAISRWCEGSRNKGKAQLGLALDRISERIMLTFQTLSPEKQSGINHRKTAIYISTGYGGESGIRTHGTVSRTHAFQACALSHSAISPDGLSLKGHGDFCKGPRAAIRAISPTD